jgi:hypothetical protein
MKYTLTIEAENIVDLEEHIHYTKSYNMLHDIYNETRAYLKYEPEPNQDKAEALLEKIKAMAAEIVFNE